MNSLAKKVVLNTSGTFFQRCFSIVKTDGMTGVPEQGKFCKWIEKSRKTVIMSI
jgi:hypothetical protein